MVTTVEELYQIFLNYRIISTDSRQIIPGCLFFALKGDNFDGNQYAQKAIESGAAYAVIDNNNFAGTNTLLVDDVLQSLQLLANMHRRKFSFPVIAITGSNGKTTTKELINMVLSQQFQITATKGNFNNHIGVPLTILGITDKTELAIVEMGANHQHEIEQLCSIAEPTHGLITNIGRAHLGGFGGYEGVIKAKSELYTWLSQSGGEAFVNAGNPLLMSLTTGMKRVMYGSAEDIVSRGIVKSNSELLAVEWFKEKESILIQTNLVGNYNFENVMAAICVGSYFNVPAGRIIKAISSYSPSNSRSQAMKTARNSVILDAYNANPTSMQVALENFRQMKAIKKMVILGDMLELGEESLKEHLAIVDLVDQSNFDKSIFVGPDFKSTVNNRFVCFSNSEEAREYLLNQNIENYLVLIKGSRGIKMEKVIDAI